jgi:hypothetical protein
MIDLRISKPTLRRLRFLPKAGLGGLALIFVLSAVAPIRAAQEEDLAQGEKQGTSPNPSEGEHAPGIMAGEATRSEQGLTPKSPVPSSDDKSATSVNMFTGLGMVSAENYQPLDRSRRWRYYVNQNFTSIGSYFGPVAISIIDQINSQPPEWGDGMEGYGKRFVSRLGTGIIQGTVQSAGAALLGQDPRYIRSADTRIPRRIGHAFLYSIITYNNEGKRRLALATLGSFYASSMLTDYWYPGRFTALGDGVRDGNRQAILSGLVNQFQEFWPEIRHYVFRQK